MTDPNYRRFFTTATLGNTPFDYQCRLACGDRDNKSEEQWLASGTLCVSRDCSEEEWLRSGTTSQSNPDGRWQIAPPYPLGLIKLRDGCVN